MMNTIGKIFISERRRRVRETVIFLFTHALFVMSVVFAASVGIIIFGLSGIYLPASLDAAIPAFPDFAEFVSSLRGVPFAPDSLYNGQ